MSERFVVTIMLIVDGQQLSTSFAETPAAWAVALQWLDEQLSIVVPRANQATLIEIRVHR